MEDKEIQQGRKVGNEGKGKDKNELNKKIDYKEKR